MSKLMRQLAAEGRAARGVPPEATPEAQAGALLPTRGADAGKPEWYGGDWYAPPPGTLPIWTGDEFFADPFPATSSGTHEEPDRELSPTESGLTIMKCRHGWLHRCGICFP